MASNLIPTLDAYKREPLLLSRDAPKILFDQNETDSIDNVSVLAKLTALKTYTLTEHENLQKQCPTLTRGTPELLTCKKRINLMAEHYHYYDTLQTAILNHKRYGGGGSRRKTMKGRRKNKSRRNRKSRR